MVSLTVSDLTVRLGERAVIQNIDVELTPGALIGIIGPNGAGKSTLIRALLGLVPPSHGSVTVDSVPLPELTRKALARKVAYLPQGQTLHWPLTVERLVTLGRLPHLAPMSRLAQEDVTIIEDAMVRADVAHLRTRPANALSGGERARVLLARALAVGAPGLIADEPLASLDPGHQIDVMDLLAREAGGGSLVITVLHDLTMAARYCDRLLLLDSGRLVGDGTPADVLTTERMRSVYHVQAMIDAVQGVPLVVPFARTPSTRSGASDHPSRRQRAATLNRP